MEPRIVTFPYWMLFNVGSAIFGFWFGWRLRGRLLAANKEKGNE